MSDSVRKAAPVSASEWDYCTIKELSAALESRQISASELLERTVARIEALDSRLNAVREAARAADIALAKGERRALLRIPLGQGSVQCCRLADDLGLPGVQGFCTAKRMHSSSPVRNVRGPSCSARPTCRWASAIFRATTTSTERPTIRGISVAPRGALQAVPLLLWQPALGHCRSDRISAGRCACRPRMPTMR